MSAAVAVVGERRKSQRVSHTPSPHICIWFIFIIFYDSLLLLFSGLKNKIFIELSSFSACVFLSLSFSLFIYWVVAVSRAINHRWVRKKSIYYYLIIIESYNAHINIVMIMMMITIIAIILYALALFSLHSIWTEIYFAVVAGCVALAGGFFLIFPAPECFICWLTMLLLIDLYLFIVALKIIERW